MEPGRKDFEDHLLSWYGLMACGVFSGGIGTVMIIFAGLALWNDTGISDQTDGAVYLLGFGLVALICGVGALGWGTVKLAIILAKRVKKLSTRR